MNRTPTDPINSRKCKISVNIKQQSDSDNYSDIAIIRRQKLHTIYDVNRNDIFLRFLCVCFCACFDVDEHCWLLELHNFFFFKTVQRQIEENRLPLALRKHFYFNLNNFVAMEEKKVYQSFNKNAALTRARSISTVTVGKTFSPNRNGEGGDYN